MKDLNMQLVEAEGRSIRRHFEGMTVAERDRPQVSC